jgi:hypothetical protein
MNGEDAWLTAGFREHARRIARKVPRELRVKKHPLERKVEDGWGT